MDIAALVSEVASSSAARRSAYLVNASKRCSDGVTTITPPLTPLAPGSAASLAPHAFHSPQVSGEKVSPGNVAISSTLRRKTTSGSNRTTLRNLVCALRAWHGPPISTCRRMPTGLGVEGSTVLASPDAELWPGIDQISPSSQVLCKRCRNRHGRLQ